jgi:hypothetical protein
MAIFAFTNGYCCTMCAILAPQSVENEHKEQVGMYVSFMISIGIMLGTVCQMLMQFIIVNPISSN